MTILRRHSPLLIITTLLCLLLHLQTTSADLPTRKLSQDSGVEHQFLSKRLLVDAYYFCFRSPSCLQYIEDQNMNYLDLSENAAMTLKLRLGDNNDDLTITYWASNNDLDVKIWIERNFAAPEEEGIVISTPSRSNSAWTTVVPAATVQNYRGKTLCLRVTNNGSEYRKAKVLMSFPVSPVLLIVLISIGGLVFIASVILGIWYLKARKRQSVVHVHSRREYIRAQFNSPTSTAFIEPQSAGLSTHFTTHNLESRFAEVKFEKIKDNSLAQTTCSICLEELKAGMLCRQLYCKHIFHSQCIKLWIVNRLAKGQACCPNCNRDISEAPH